MAAPVSRLWRSVRFTNPTHRLRGGLITFAATRLEIGFWFLVSSEVKDKSKISKVKNKSKVQDFAPRLANAKPEML
jgi:hypothetical protein